MAEDKKKSSEDKSSEKESAKSSEDKSSEKAESTPKPPATAKRIAVRATNGRRSFVRELKLGPEPVELVVADLSAETKAELIGPTPNPSASVTVLE